MLFFSSRFRASIRSGALVVAALAATAAPALADIHIGDHLTVTVYDHPELSGDSVVSSDGAINVALLGRVHAAGVESSTLANTIAARLRRFVIDPAVEIKLENEGDAAFVSGGATGTIALKPGETLLSAIDDAKVGTQADLRRVSIVRDGRVVGKYDVQMMRTTGTEGPMILSGDTIRVPTRPIDVDVVGAVKTAGNFYLEADEPLGDAIQQAGVGDDANLERITLERGGSSELVTLGGDVLLQPAQYGDRLIVPQSELVEVVGFVDKPGVVALKTDETLLSALFLAGGPAKDGDLRRVRVVHRDGKRTDYDLRGYAKGDISQNPTLKDGDIVYVSEQHGFDFRILFDVLLFGTRFIKF
jgi:protein involved in polysaccharide export with SLBB domain